MGSDLLDNLVRRTSIKHRNGVGYITVRSWRADARAAALQAFKAEKKAKTPAALDAAAAEIAAELRTQFGSLEGWQATCVACGHSNDPECWGKLLAQTTARVLGIPFAQVFHDRFVSGSSHPKEFAKLPPLQRDQQRSGPMVIIDDVATSGWHLEEAVIDLRQDGPPVLAVAWIGGVLGAEKTEAPSAPGRNVSSASAAEVSAPQPAAVDLSEYGPTIPKPGRPTDYSEERAADICMRLVEGESLRTICSVAEMPNKATVFRWLARHEDFRDQYARAREAQADRLFEECIEIADDTRDDIKLVGGDDGPPVEVVDHEHISRSKLRVDTRKWMAGKLAPKRFGDKVVNEHSGLDGAPIPIAATATVILTGAPASALASEAVVRVPQQGD